jgi:CubicO group peptidase (beta-lactamase class C family)
MDSFPQTLKRMKPLTCLLILLTLRAALVVAEPLSPKAAEAAGFDSERLTRVRTSMEALVNEGKQAGVVWLIARNGHVVESGATGLRDREANLPMQRDTICRIYSMTKIVTSVAVLILMEDGKLLLDDDVAAHLPELKGMKVAAAGSPDNPAPEPLKTPITIRHLLTHTSGLIYDFDGSTALHEAYKAAKLWDSTSLAEFTAKVAKLPLKHQPGTQFTYGISSDVLGALIERISGMSFPDFCRTRIFEPLKMSDTAFDVLPEKRARLAKTYSLDASGKLAEAPPMLGVWPEPGRGIASGGAGLFSTVDDYARFAQMLLNGGTLDGARVLSRKTVELMTANHLTMLDKPHHAHSPAHGYGLGVEVRTDLGRTTHLSSVGQYGWYGAATTLCHIDPQEKMVVLAFSQHFPFNEHRMFARFANACYQALK